MNQRIVVFPRGINVGGHNKVPMPALRADLEKAGFTSVKTLLASGNIIVTVPDRVSAGTGHEATDAAGAAVREVIRTSSGTDVDCLVRSADEIRTIAERNPLRDIAENGSRHLVTFLSEPLPDALLAEIASEDYAPNVHKIIGREMYTWAPDGVLAVVLNDRVLMKRGGVLATGRNWNTIEKIMAAL